MKATIIVYAIGERMNYNTYIKKEFVIVEKPAEPWFKSDKKYL